MMTSDVCGLCTTTIDLESKRACIDLCDIIPFVDLLDVVRIEPFYTVRASKRSRSDSFESIAVLLFLTVAVLVPSILQFRSKDYSSRLDGLVVRTRVSEQVEEILAGFCRYACYAHT
jgi:succinate dehydrogenase/fumarate reductase-like Fe-S protein